MFQEVSQIIQYMPRISVHVYASRSQLQNLFNFKDVNMFSSCETIRKPKNLSEEKSLEGYSVDYFTGKQDRTQHQQKFIQIRVEQKVKNTFNTFYRNFGMYIRPHLPVIEKSTTLSSKILHSLPFICIKDKPGEDHNHYELSYGDYIRVGSVFFKVLDIDNFGNSSKYVKQSKQSSDQQCEMDFHNQETAVQLERNSNYMQSEQTADERRTCRYCLEEQTKKNSLISLCECRGTMQFLHLKCLRNWRVNCVQQKKQSPRVYRYLQKSFKCQICKKSYSSIIKDSKSKNALVCNFVRPNSPHIILQLIEEEGNDKSIFVLFPDQQSTNIRIGSGNVCDLRINDKSLEQIHASVIFCDNRVYLSDMDSTFGTSCLLQREEMIEQGQQIFLQKRNKVYKFQLQPGMRRAKRK